VRALRGRRPSAPSAVDDPDLRERRAGDGASPSRNASGEGSPDERCARFGSRAGVAGVNRAARAGGSPDRRASGRTTRVGGSPDRRASGRTTRARGLPERGASARAARAGGSPSRGVSGPPAGTAEPGSPSARRRQVRRSTTEARSPSGSRPRSDATGTRGPGPARSARRTTRWAVSPDRAVSPGPDDGSRRSAGTPSSRSATIRSRPGRAAARARRQAPRRCRASP
jgi:hypothetical protein